MAPNPNECVVMIQGTADAGQLPAARMAPVPVKLIVTMNDDSSEDSNEHFYDASSEAHFSSDDGDAATIKVRPPLCRTDSGVEADDEFVVPTAELVAQINEQVEFYFSDEHILKDAFLLKHARRNRDGYISLKLITSFKKVCLASWSQIELVCLI